MPRMQGNTVSSNNYFFIDWNLNGQNVAGNYSNIGWAAYWHFQSNDRQLDNGYANLGDVNRWSNGGRIYNYSGNFSTRDLLLASGSFDIGHDSNGNKTLNVAGGATGYNGSRSEGSGSWSLPTIPRHAVLNSSPNFNDEQNPTFNYSNPAGTAVDFYMEFPGIGGSLAARNLGSGGGGNYTLVLTNAERDALRAKQPNAATMTVRFVIHDSLGGSNSWSYQDRTLTFINGNPVFSAANITYLDTDSGVVAITTDDQKIVQNKSDLNVSFTAATPVKAATISSYKVTLDTDIQTKTAASTIDYGPRNLATDTPVTIEVTDSRGFKTTASKTITILPWAAPRAVITASRLNNYEDTTNVKAVVTIDSVDGKNAIQSIALRYKKTTDVSWTSTTMTHDVNKVLTLNKLFEWNLEITITDKFGSTVYTALVQKGIPIMFIDPAKLSIGIGKFPSGNETFEVADNYLVPIMKKVYPVGRIIMSTSSTNPGTLPELAGTTWAAWGVGRVPVGVDGSQTEFDTVEETGGHKLMQSHTHSMRYAVQGSGGGINGIYGMPYNASANGSVVTQSGEPATSGELRTGVLNNGGGNAQNLQPYITVYMWKRTA